MNNNKHLTICDSNKRICNLNNKNFSSVDSIISGNSRPYNNTDESIPSGPGFIPRRYLTSSGSTIIKSGSNRHNRNVSAAPNPIKHWRRQLIPRENSGTGKASVSQIMDRPGGSNYITTNENNFINNNSINCIKSYIETNDPSNIVCNPICKKKIIRGSVSCDDNYHTSSTSYLQSRVKTYDRIMARTEISGINYNNLPSDSSIGSQNYYSQYNKNIYDPSDNSTCLDCSCVSRIIYKPNNRNYLKQGAVSSSIYTSNLKQNINQLCIIRNKWGLDGVCSDKYTGVDYINNNNKNLCKSKTSNLSKRYSSGGVGNHTVCFYTPSSNLEQQLGGKLHSIRGTGTGKHISTQDKTCNKCKQPICSGLITRGKLRCKCTELTLQQKCDCSMATTEEYYACGYTVFIGSEYVVNIVGELLSTDYNTHIPTAELKQVKVGSNVTSIGNKAFYHCNNLTSVSISDSVTSIGEKVFEDCFKLTYVNFNNSSQLLEIGRATFAQNSILESITIPASVKTLGIYLFSNCLSLKKVHFEQNSNLNEFNTGLFYECNTLESKTIPKSIETISNNVFKGCQSLASITFEDIANSQLTSIGNNVFDLYYGNNHNNTLQSVTLPPSLTCVGANLFSNCSDLSYIEFLGSRPTLNGILSSTPLLGDISVGVFSNLRTAGVDPSTNIIVPNHPSWTEITSIDGYPVVVNYTELFNSNDFSLNIFNDTSTNDIAPYSLISSPFRIFEPSMYRQSSPGIYNFNPGVQSDISNIYQLKVSGNLFTYDDGSYNRGGTTITLDVSVNTAYDVKLQYDVVSYDNDFIGLTYNNSDISYDYIRLWPQGNQIEYGNSSQDQGVYTISNETHSVDITSLGGSTSSSKRYRMIWLYQPLPNTIKLDIYKGTDNIISGTDYSGNTFLSHTFSNPVSNMGRGIFDNKIGIYVTGMSQVYFRNILVYGVSL
jgi:hypothetical protein